MTTTGMRKYFILDHETVLNNGLTTDHLKGLNKKDFSIMVDISIRKERTL